MSDLYLMHEGTPHEGDIPHSGRYEWGSGKNPNQHPKGFIEHVNSMYSQGLTEGEVAKGMNMSVRELRAQIRNAKTNIRQSNREEAIRLAGTGMGPSEIGRVLGIPESSVRNLINRQDISDRKEITNNTADLLRKEVEKYTYVDVGHGIPETLGISQERLKAAVTQLKNDGYSVHKYKVPQAGNPDQYTQMMVLTKPDVSWNEGRLNLDKIHIINERYVDPQGTSRLGLEPVKSISSDRIQVAYDEDGGSKKDGIIELRRGVDGLDLGNARYAQVRIGVDDTHYLKGMAIYSDDLPDGVDIRFNTHYSKDDPKRANKLDVFKPMERLEDGSVDADNPFGSYIKAGGQRGYLNIVREEGDWSTWSKTLASQMLSKQPVALAKKQLDLTKDIRVQELEEINSLTNPVVKKHLLMQFADSCDRAAVHLKAAAMPRQGSHVILPLTTIKENQIYAPNYKNGEKVVLIRYPHGGTFEIPELTVNNNNLEAKRLFKNANDAVGIHHSVAERLSGADFDGDTVVVIPNNSRKILTSGALKGLEGFDPKKAYPERKGMKYMGDEQTQIQMGIISNLITDMTLQDAPADHVARAVRHSMVVIDAHKHKLDYKQSEKDNNIDELQRIYQKKAEPKGNKTYGGASTLISRAKSEYWVPHRESIKGDRGIDPLTGEKLFKYTGKTIVDKKGNEKPKRTKSTQMAEAKDARALISTKGTLMENVYADYANSMKALANEARKEYLKTPDPKINSAARLKYKPEVESISRKVSIASQHQPYERKAQILANHITRMKVADNPTMTKEERKKVQTQALGEMRKRLGGSRPTVDISDREWEAIQAGAISKTMLQKAMKYTDQDALKQRALPISAKGMTSSKLSLAKSMKANGYTMAEISQRLGLSTSTISKALNE